MGDRFGKLVIVGRAGTDALGYPLWKVKCDCGKTIICLTVRLKSPTKRLKSCGCTYREGANLVHGYSKSRVYRIWSGIKSKCENEGDRLYWKYGGRNIRVCKKWLKFTNFLSDMGEPPSENHMLGRLSTSKGYMPSNCAWMTYEEIAKKRNGKFPSRAKTICVGGDCLTVHQWAKVQGISSSRMWERIREWGDQVLAVSTPRYGRSREFREGQK